MTYDSGFSRRAALKFGASIGVTFLAAPALAALPAGKRKLVVIICRGAMDGLSVSPPINDSNYYALRGPIAIPADREPHRDVRRRDDPEVPAPEGA